METERARWAGRITFAIATELADHASDGYRVLARMVEGISAGDRYNARDLSRDLAVKNQTLHDRWLDAKLPPLKRYFDALELVRAASVAEAYPEEPLYRHGKRLGFEHQQDYYRWIRRASGLRPSHFAIRSTDSGALEGFLCTFIRPHAERLRAGHFLTDVRAAKRLAARKAHGSQR
jgi:hypothetical protein